MSPDCLILRVLNPLAVAESLTERAQNDPWLSPFPHAAYAAACKGAAAHPLEARIRSAMIAPPPVAAENPAATWTLDVAGCAPCVPAYLAGLPEAMIAPARSSASGRPRLRVGVSIAYFSAYDASEMANRLSQIASAAASVASVADVVIVPFAFGAWANPRRPRVKPVWSGWDTSANEASQKIQTCSAESLWPRGRLIIWPEFLAERLDKLAIVADPRTFRVAIAKSCAALQYNTGTVGNANIPYAARRALACDLMIEPATILPCLYPADMVRQIIQALADRTSQETP